MIEAGASREDLAEVVQNHVRAIASRIGRAPDRAILGCTHYEIVADLFRAALPPGTPVIHQPQATAEALARYFDRHPEYATGSGAVRRFLTTGKPGAQSGLVEALDRKSNTSELQSLMRISYAVFCLKKKKTAKQNQC